MSYKLTIRPHHIMCINNFVGKGYSDEFVENMRQVTDSLDNDSEVCFTECCDILCAHCPNRKGNCCTKESHIKALDNNTISKFNLDLNKSYLWKELKHLYDNLIVRNNDLDSVCFECSWKDICSQNIKAMH